MLKRPHPTCVGRMDRPLLYSSYTRQSAGDCMQRPLISCAVEIPWAMQDLTAGRASETSTGWTLSGWASQWFGARGAVPCRRRRPKLCQLITNPSSRALAPSHPPRSLPLRLPSHQQQALGGKLGPAPLLGSFKGLHLPASFASSASRPGLSVKTGPLPCSTCPFDLSIPGPPVGAIIVRRATQQAAQPL